MYATVQGLCYYSVSSTADPACGESPSVGLSATRLVYSRGRNAMYRKKNIWYPNYSVRIDISHQKLILNVTECDITFGRGSNPHCSVSLYVNFMCLHVQIFRTAHDKNKFAGTYLGHNATYLDHYPR